MKKSLFFIIILAITLLLSSCDLGAITSPDNDNMQTVYEKLEDMADADYPIISVTVSYSHQGVELTDRYMITDEGKDTLTVEYICERRSVFENGIIPDEDITTYRGTIVIKDKNIISNDGDDLVIAFDSFNVKNLDFSESNFYDAENTRTDFKAKIKEISKFFTGSNLDLASADIEVKYGAKFKEIILNYKTSDGASFKTTYDFTAPST